MTASSNKGLIIAVAVLALVAGAALAFVIHQMRLPVQEAKTTTPAPSAAAAPRETPPPSVATAQKEAGAIVTALGGAPPSKPVDDSVPSFDIARIEPSGDAVIAGRAMPGATVELLRNGEPFDRTVVDQSGQFAMVPPPLPSGTYDLTLRAREKDGKQTTSTQSVAVSIAPNTREKPVVALVTPGKPTTVLSQPAAPGLAGTVVVESVEIQQDGKFHVSGRARAGAAVRFYLNDTFVAPVTAAADGRLSVTVNEGVSPGGYRVRLDEVEASSGKVLARAEVPFTVPAKVAAASVPTPASKQPDVASASPPSQRAAPTSAAPQPATVAVPVPTSQTAAGAIAAQPQPASPAGTSPAAQPPVVSAAPRPPMPSAGSGASPSPQAAAAPPAGSPSAVIVPRVATATVVPGDSLWRISELTYGAGISYGVIYKANQEQIRNPHLIYPGQIFVLPAQ